MIKWIFTILLSALLTSCGGSSNATSEDYYEVEEILNVNEIWVDEMPSKYTELIRLYDAAYSNDLENEYELFMAFQNYIREYNISERSTYIKIPSTLLLQESLQIEVYGIWHYDGDSRGLDGCGNRYVGYKIVQNNNSIIKIELKKIQIYGENNVCTDDEPFMNLALKDTITIENLTAGEYQVVIENPNGEQLTSTLLVQ